MLRFMTFLILMISMASNVLSTPPEHSNRENCASTTVRRLAASPTEQDDVLDAPPLSVGSVTNRSRSPQPVPLDEIACRWVTALLQVNTLDGFIQVIESGNRLYTGATQAENTKVCTNLRRALRSCLKAQFNVEYQTEKGVLIAPGLVTDVCVSAVMAAQGRSQLMLLERSLAEGLDFIHKNAGEHTLLFERYLIFNLARQQFSLKNYEAAAHNFELIRENLSEEMPEEWDFVVSFRLAQAYAHLKKLNESHSLLTTLGREFNDIVRALQPLDSQDDQTALQGYLQEIIRLLGVEAAAQPETIERLVEQEKDYVLSRLHPCRERHHSAESPSPERAHYKTPPSLVLTAIESDLATHRIKDFDAVLKRLLHEESQVAADPLLKFRYQYLQLCLLAHQKPEGMDEGLALLMEAVRILLTQENLAEREQQELLSLFSGKSLEMWPQPYKVRLVVALKKFLCNVQSDHGVKVQSFLEGVKDYLGVWSSHSKQASA